MIALVIHAFDYIAVLCLGFMSFGILKQWWHIYRTGSAEGIVTTEVVIRFIVTFLLLVKIILVGDPYLIAGQLLLAGAISVYLFTLLPIKKLQAKNPN